MKDDTGSDIEYKGNRVQSDEFDWDMIFAEFNAANMYGSYSVPSLSSNEILEKNTL